MNNQTSPKQSNARAHRNRTDRWWKWFICPGILLLELFKGESEGLRIRNKNFKIGHHGSCSLENEESSHFTLLFCRERQGNVPKIITSSCIANVIVSFAITVLVCFFNSLKPNKSQPIEFKPNESSCSRTERQPIFGMERRLKIKKSKRSSHHISCHVHSLWQLRKRCFFDYALRE